MYIKGPGDRLALDTWVEVVDEEDVETSDEEEEAETSEAEGDAHLPATWKRYKVYRTIDERITCDTA